jgi:hypothetical protein
MTVCWRQGLPKWRQGPLTTLSDNVVKTYWLQDRIDFDDLNVRYLWPLVRPQYSPLESRPTLHNPLGLSHGLKSSSTSPQNRTKAAAIAMQFHPKIGIMRQSPSCRTRYIFYGIKMSDIESPQNARKSASMHSSHTPNNSCVVRFCSVQ